MNFKKLASINKGLDLNWPEKSMNERVSEKYSKEEIETIVNNVTNSKNIDEMYSYTDDILQEVRIKSSRPDAIKKGLLDILNALLKYKL